jgi:hypothetical protein
MSDFPREVQDDDTGRPEDAGSSLPPSALRLLQLARQEAPRADLDTQVLESVSYRARVLGSEVRSVSVWSSRALAVAGGLALAASLLLWLSREPTEPTEPSDASQHSQIELGREPMEGLPGASTVSTNAVESAPVAVEDPCKQVLVASGSQPLIDDFEDGDDAIMPFEHRDGLWRWVRDTDAPGTAPALLPVPRPGTTAKNQLALHVKGDRLREWGATVEFVFGNRCYDASAYAGIAFAARGSTRVYLAPREVSVMPVSAGGICVEDCHNNHVKQIRLEPNWQTFEVRFDEVEQRGYDRPRLDPKRLHSVAFLIRPEDTPYDVWIDEVRFIER